MNIDLTDNEAQTIASGMQQVNGIKVQLADLVLRQRQLEQEIGQRDAGLKQMIESKIMMASPGKVTNYRVNLETKVIEVDVAPEPPPDEA